MSINGCCNALVSERSGDERHDEHRSVGPIKGYPSARACELVATSTTMVAVGSDYSRSLHLVVYSSPPTTASTSLSPGRPAIVATVASGLWSRTVPGHQYIAQAHRPARLRPRVRHLAWRALARVSRCQPPRLRLCV